MTSISTNALLAFPNYSDISPVNGAFTGVFPVISGGLWQAGAPLANLQNRLLSHKSRSLSLTPDSTQFLVDLGQLRYVSAVVVPQHNMTLAATFSLACYQDAALSIQVGSTITGSVFQGGLTPETAALYPTPFLVILPAAPVVVARYVQIIFSDTANPAGYIELSRLIIAPGYQASLNVKFGSTIGVRDTTVVTPSASEVDFFDQRTRRRVAVVSWDYLPQAEALAFALDYQMRLGLSGQVFFSLFPADTVNLARCSFLASAEQLDPITAATYNTSSVTFTLKEVVG